MRVTIDHAKLVSAAEKLSSLASRVESQANRATSNTPIGLDSLTSSTIRTKVQWMRDQQPLLDGLADIALLLDTDGNGSSSFEVGNTVTDVKQMLGETLADQAGQGNPYDPERSKAYLELFQQWCRDPEVTSSFHDKLGAEGTLRTLSMWAEDVDDYYGDEETQRALVAAMKISLESATQGWTDTENRRFAEDMVTAATVDPEEIAGRGPYNPSGALAFLLYDGHFKPAFLSEVGAQLDHYEREVMDGAPGLWGHRPDQGVPFGDYLPFGAAMTYNNLDPMTSLMSAFENDPATGLQFFDGDDRAKYYIQERNWDQDGYDAITGALDAATTDHDLISDPHSETAKDAALLAARTVHYLAHRDNAGELGEQFNRGAPENNAAENLAHILSTYMVGVDQAVINDTPFGDGEGPSAGEVYSDALGRIGNVPAFELDSLRTLIPALMANDEGFGQLRTGLNEYRAAKLGALADGLVGQDDIAGREALQRAIGEDASLEGFFIEAFGDDQISDARDRDAAISAWVDTASGVIDLIPVPGVSKIASQGAQEVVSFAIDNAKGQGYDAIKEALAHYEGDAVDDSNELARTTVAQQELLIASLLDDRGLSADPDGMSDVTRPGGSVLSWDELQQLNPSERNLVLSELFSVDLGVGQHLDRNEYEGIYLDQFKEYFEEAGG